MLPVSAYLKWLRLYALKMTLHNMPFEVTPEKVANALWLPTHGRAALGIAIKK